MLLGEKLYDWMTGHDFVSTLARLHGMTREEASDRASHVLDFVGLSDVQNKEIGIGRYETKVVLMLWFMTQI